MTKAKAKTPELQIHALILEGKETNEILTAMAKVFPKFNMTNRTVSFHRTMLRKLGHTLPRANRNDKGVTRGANAATTSKPAAVKKAPAKRKAAVKKAPAKAKVAPKKAAVKKAPAKRKAAVKKTPAKKKAASKRSAKSSKAGAKARKAGGSSR